MSAPQRVQLHRTRGWRKPEGAVVVARPSKWGNPFRIRPAVEAVRAFAWAVDAGLCDVPSPEQIRTELRGKDLACWCPLDQPCHADVLLEIANGPTS